MRNKQGIGFNIDDSCWNLDLKFENEILPTSSRYIMERSKDSFCKSIIKTIGGIKQKYTNSKW